MFNNERTDRRLPTADRSFCTVPGRSNTIGSLLCIGSRRSHFDDKTQNGSYCRSRRCAVAKGGNYSSILTDLFSSSHRQCVAWMSGWSSLVRSLFPHDCSSCLRLSVIVRADIECGSIVTLSSRRTNVYAINATNQSQKPASDVQQATQKAYRS